MLHLFNKVYVEFDDKIEIGFDRVVISERYGIPMLQQLDKVAGGELLSFGKSYKEVIGNDFINFLTSLKDFGTTSDKRIIIYCDNDAYKKLVAQWFVLIMPDLTLKEFKTIIKYTVYNQRITSNTQLSSVHSVDMNNLWEGIGEVDAAWKSAKVLPEAQVNTFKGLGVNLSYEFLLASYLSGDDRYKEAFRKTLHMFLRRWFKEILSDNRQMVLLNLTNHRFLSTFNIDPESVDLTKIDPLEGIVGFEVYSDDEIWERSQTQYGVCKLEGLSDEKSNGLMILLKKVYGEFEGMQLDRSVFSLDKYIGCTSRETLTDEEVKSLVDLVVNNPFDTCLVPRFDFQNVNFPLMQYFLSQKFNGKDLSKYRLF